MNSHPKLTEIPAFNAYMAQGWGTPDRTPPVVSGAPEAAAAHRARLAAALPGRDVTVAAGHAPIRSNDTAYDFRPDSDFYWLTGCQVEGGVLVMRGGDATLYLPPPPTPASRASSATPCTVSCGSAPRRDWPTGRPRSASRCARSPRRLPWRTPRSCAASWPSCA
ncbi:aminopeptidase P N-terminal domain-containing protein [Streptosporangium lutulentum]